MFDDLRDLYQEVILDHGRKPRNFRRLEEADREGRGDNPMCGDRMQLWVKLAPDGRLDDVAFQGKGEQTRFIHDRYPSKGCAIAIEFKKFFMDEWSGEPDAAELDAMRRFVTMSADTAAALLG